MSRIDLILASIYQGTRSQFNTTEWESFQDTFASEEDCVAFLFQAKWPNGFSCPRCNHKYAHTIHSRRLPLYQCYGCRHQTSLTAGTIMEKSRTPLRKWLSAFYLISRVDSYVNAIQLSERIQVTYKTAWAMMHAIRQAISNVDSVHRLSGTIKGGIGFCGQIPFNSTMAREQQEKPVIFGASLDEHGQPTEFKMKVVPNRHLSNKYLERSGIRDFVQRFVQDDGMAEDVQFLQRYALYKILPVKKIFDQTMYRFRRVFRGLTSRHLQLYLDEATYRINLTLQNVPIFDNLSRLCMTRRLCMTSSHISTFQDE